MFELSPPIEGIGDEEHPAKTRLPYGDSPERLEVEFGDCCDRLWGGRGGLRRPGFLW